MPFILYGSNVSTDGVACISTRKACWTDIRFGLRCPWKLGGDFFLWNILSFLLNFTVAAFLLKLSRYQGEVERLVSWHPGALLLAALCRSATLADSFLGTMEIDTSNFLRNQHEHQFTIVSQIWCYEFKNVFGNQNFSRCVYYYPSNNEYS